MKTDLQSLLKDGNIFLTSSSRCLLPVEYKKKEAASLPAFFDTPINI